MKVIVPGKNAERNVKGGQCRVQCTRGSHLCSDTRGKAVRSAQDRPEQQWVLKKTRSTTLPPSAMEPRSLTVATQTKYWKYLGNIGNIWLQPWLLQLRRKAMNWFLLRRERSEPQLKTTIHCRMSCSCRSTERYAADRYGPLEARTG